MNNIEQYRKRFYGLMESTIGDVRPLSEEETSLAKKQSKTHYAFYKFYTFN